MIERDRHCKACDLSKTCQWVCLWGDGPKQAKVMLIGEAPGRDEDAEGKPFIGKAGRLLEQIFGDVGLERKDVYITNAVKCRPPQNRTPTRKEITICRKYLVSEIEQVKPETIICLGVSAIKALTGDHRLSVSKARTTKYKYRGAHVRSTYHPASVFRTPYFYKVLQEDFSRFFGGAAPRKTARIQELVKPHELWKYLQAFATKGTVALDLETNGLDPFAKNARIWTVGFSMEEGESFVVPIHHRESPNPSPETSLAGINQWITSNPEMRVVGHNIKFDLKWLRQFGCEVKCKVFDTMIACHLLDENYPNKGLKHLAQIYTDMGDYSKELKTLAKEKDKYPDLHYPLKALVQYNGDDADATLRLYHVFTKMLAAEGLVKQMSFNMLILKTLIEMEFNGIKVNQATLYKLVTEYEGKLKEVTKFISKELPNVNPDSPKQLVEALYKSGRYKAWKTTEKGAPSTDEEALQGLAKYQKCEVAQKLIDRRKITKVLRTYLHGKAAQIGNDGRIHTTFHLASMREEGEFGERGGTVTGRLGSDMQQIPKVGGIKSMFESRFKNGLICQADYSQIELRVLAHFAQDKTMLQTFEDPKADIHRAIAAKVFRKEEADVTPLERSKCKAVNFGIVYCIGPARLAENIGTSTAQAQRFIREWYDQFPNVERWLRKTEEQVMRTGCVSTLFGRKRRLIGGTRATAIGREILRQGINSPIQGTASELTLFSMSLLLKRLKQENSKALLMLNVHDSVVLDLPASEKETVQHHIKTIFENPPIEKTFGVRLDCPLKIDIKFGRTWQECEEYE